MDAISGTAARPGWVYLVGAGPGDPGLLTQRGAELLSSADQVVHDPVDADLLELVRGDAVAATTTTEATPSEIVAAARAGRSVVRLLAGDPLLCGGGAPLALALRAAGIPFEVVPGVATALGAAAYAGVALEPAGRAVTLLDLRQGSTAYDWKSLAGRHETVCVHLDVGSLAAVSRGLMIDAGWSADTPAAVVQRPSDPQQRCLDASLGAVAAAAADAGLDGELLLFLGDSVGKRSTLSWFDTQPLFGQRVLVTRPAHQAAPTLAALRRRGAIGIPFATIAIEPPPDPARVAEAVRELAGYDVVVFTSDNGVGWFWREIERQGRDARAFGKAKLAAIGPATAAGLRARGIAADVVAETFVAEHLAAAILKAVGGRGGRVLLPRALVAREILPEMLRAAGMQVDVVPVYRTVGASAERRGELASLLDTVDLVMLTSSSTVEHLAAILGDEAAARLSGCKLASIGPITTKTAEMLGLRVWVSAEVSTAAGLIDAMERELRAGA